ncbi:MAG: tetratricopeptide repeat protein [Clostridia bacterium]|nr:tetratricopeptide repeat protein [Clostridia bacterium]
MSEHIEETQSETLSYSSISEIRNALMRNANNPRELYRYIQDNYNRWIAESDKPEDEKTIELIRGSEIDFHNLTVEFSRQDCEPFAASIALIGVETYPMSTDLIADLIKYSQEIGDIEMCQYGIEKLNTIDRKYWTWRTFVFVIDYLKDSMGSVKSIDTYLTNIEEAKKLIEDFKKYIPHEERAYVAEAELHQNQNEYQDALSALLNGVKNVAVAPQCCMKLADYYLELGEYDEAEKFARKGLLTSVQDQPTVSVGYLYYILALSLDAKRIIARQAGKIMDSSEITDILTAYQTADRLLINEGRTSVSYRKTIEARKIMLEMEEGLSEESSISEPEKEKAIEKLSKIANMLSLRDVMENKTQS